MPATLSPALSQLAHDAQFRNLTVGEAIPVLAQTGNWEVAQQLAAEVARNPNLKFVTLYELVRSSFPLETPNPITFTAGGGTLPGVYPGGPTLIPTLPPAGMFVGAPMSRSAYAAAPGYSVSPEGLVYPEPGLLPSTSYPSGAWAGGMATYGPAPSAVQSWYSGGPVGGPGGPPGGGGGDGGYGGQTTPYLPESGGYSGGGTGDIGALGYVGAGGALISGGTQVANLLGFGSSYPGLSAGFGIGGGVLGLVGSAQGGYTKEDVPSLLMSSAQIYNAGAKYVGLPTLWELAKNAASSIFGQQIATELAEAALIPVGGGGAVGFQGTTGTVLPTVGQEISGVAGEVGGTVFGETLGSALGEAGSTVGQTVASSAGQLGVEFTEAGLIPVGGGGAGIASSAAGGYGGSLMMLAFWGVPTLVSFFAEQAIQKERGKIWRQAGAEIQEWPNFLQDMETLANAPDPVTWTSEQRAMYQPLIDRAMNYYTTGHPVPISRKSIGNIPSTTEGLPVQGGAYTFVNTVYPAGYEAGTVVTPEQQALGWTEGVMPPGMGPTIDLGFSPEAGRAVSNRALAAALRADPSLAARLDPQVLARTFAPQGINIPQIERINIGTPSYYGSEGTMVRYEEAAPNPLWWKLYGGGTGPNPLEGGDLWSTNLPQALYNVYTYYGMDPNSPEAQALVGYGARPELAVGVQPVEPPNNP